jgi:DNA-binding transcriptional ArsR family regulator
VHLSALADHRADHRVQAGAVSATCQDTDAHAFLPLSTRAHSSGAAGVQAAAGTGVLTTDSVRGNLPFVTTYAAADGWDALGDSTRRAIVACLAERPRAVGELADALPVSRPAVSQHLKVLKEAGLVTERAAGTRRIYRLNPAGVAALRDQLDMFWSRALAGYEDAVDDAAQERS